VALPRASVNCGRLFFLDVLFGSWNLNGFIQKPMKAAHYLNSDEVGVAGSTPAEIYSKPLFEPILKVIFHQKTAQKRDLKPFLA
jgi:hypothetical protein